MEVNEEIIEQYLKFVQGWFYISDISFRVPRNYSNIDLLAFDPKSGNYYDIEVKYRSAFSLPAKSLRGGDQSLSSVNKLVAQFTSRNRAKRLSQYTNGKKPRKILVTNKRMFGRSETKRAAMERAFRAMLKQKGHRRVEVWYFDDIIPKIVANVHRRGRYNTELLQAIRMIKDFQPELKALPNPPDAR